MSDQRFLVTARKYRPQLFQELVAQEHVTGTLKNALRLDRLAHAYLFSGPRGVGKTTAARILAKAINCTTPPEDRIDQAEPCRQCASCESFEQGRNLNIIEIDAASNNKVEDIRDLRETVRIPPQGARKKVYIVDEVHMLTTQAFNALLKTLEEPPAHALFIFATTEPHKVLPTIQSRCQRFDFRRISVQEIFGRLEDICTSEGVTADEGALMLISRKGDGALRDALSVFKQAVSLCGADLRLDTLVDALGVVDEELYFEVTDNVASSNVAGMIGLVDRIVTSGYDLQEFLDGLAEHLRNVLVALAMPDTSLIEAAEATRARYTEIAKTFTRNQVLRLLAGIDGTMDGLRTARQPRLRLELALIRMASLPATTDIKEALRRIEQLAKAGGRESHGSTSGGAAVVVAPSASTAVSASVAAPRTPPDPPPSAPATPKPALTPASAKAPTARSEPTQAPAQAAPAQHPPPAAPVPPPTPAAAPAPPTPSPDPSTVAPTTPAPAPATPAPTPPTTPAPAPPPTAPAPAPATPNPAPAPARAAPPPSTAAPDQTVPAPPPEDPGQGTLFNAGRSMSVFGTPALRRPEPVDSSPSVQPAAGVGVLEMPTTQVRGDSIETELWETVVSSVMSSKIHLGALLHHAQAVIREGSTLALIVPDDFHARVLREAQPDLLRGLADVGLDQVSRIEFEVNGEVRSEAEPNQENVDPQEAIRRLCEEYPALQLLMERFGGEIVW